MIRLSGIGGNIEQDRMHAGGTARMFDFSEVSDAFHVDAPPQRVA